MDKSYLFGKYGIKSLKEITGCLSNLAFDPGQSKGRRLLVSSQEDEIFGDCLDPFWFDYIKILNSKSFRRLKDKTQVFVNTDSCHTTTRARHTFEVIGIGVMLANLLGLNVNLVNAICAAHDIGHGPYGYVGEQVYFDKFGKKFKHDVFGVVIAQKIERAGGGLNLSYETLEGISLHSGSTAVIQDKPLEYSLVRIADKISYILGDINDAVRHGLIDTNDLPNIISDLGITQRERVMKLVCEIVVASAKEQTLVFESTELGQKFLELKKWMYKNIYVDNNNGIHKEALKITFEFLDKEFPGRVQVLWPLLTDREVDELSRLTQHSRKITLNDIKHFGITEIINSFERMNTDWNINIHDTDLAWGNR